MQTPRGGGESGIWKILLLDKALVTVVEGEGTHAVENSAAAIKEHGRVSIALKDARDGLDVLRAIPFDDGIAGQWGKGGENPFKAAHRPVPGGVHIFKQHALVPGQLVHPRSQRWSRSSEGSPEFRAETFLEENDDIQARPVGVAVNAALEGIEGIGKMRHWLPEQLPAADELQDEPALG